MKAVFWIGLVVPILGTASLVVPIPRNEKEGIKIGDTSVGVETHHEERLAPFLSAVLILGGAGAMVAGRMKSRS